MNGYWWKFVFVETAEKFRFLLFWDDRRSIVRFPVEINYSLLQVFSCSMRIWDSSGIVRWGCAVEHFGDSAVGVSSGVLRG
jgi:hypothetical protein